MYIKERPLWFVSQKLCHANLIVWFYYRLLID